ncbi:MAG: di-heme enzyme [Sphingobacteriales bacterium]|nr:MAG: di-heme enzyme [Sphingobacteriales bacterium]
MQFNWFNLALLIVGLPLAISSMLTIGQPPQTKGNQEVATELGRHLFYDSRLSATGEKSCATCHDQRFAFTDGHRRSPGLFGDMVKHNSLPLFNLDYYRSFTWDNPALETLEQQLLLPMFGDSPPEMGLKGHEEEVLNRLKRDTLYPAMFQQAYGENAITMDNAIKALAQFCNSIESFNTPFNNGTMSESAERGWLLFTSDRLKCFNCHAGPNFNQTPEKEGAEGNFANVGLYNAGSTGAYPIHDQGLIAFTKQSADMGKFRTPSLRNLAFTAPYFHDGSARTLEEVIEIYDRGGRNWDGALDTGDGKDNPYKNEDIAPLNLTKQEKEDLIDFLMSLNDTSLMTNPKFSDPFTH